MISKVISRKPGNDNYRGLAKYIADASHEGEKCLLAWTEGCWAGDDYEMAIMEIEATQALNQRTRKAKTYHMMISFRPEDEDKLTDDVLKEIEKEFAKALGFEEHQRHCGVHKNTNNIHMHVAYNMIHPEWLTRHEPFRDYWKRDKVCRELERKYGLAIDNGREIQQDIEPKRDNDRADTYEAHSGQQSLDSYVKEQKELITTALQRAGDWQKFQESLAEIGLEVSTRGNGCVFKDRHGRHAVKASSLGREFSKNAFEKKFGKYRQPENLDKVVVRDRYDRKPLQHHSKTDALFVEFTTAMNAPRVTDKATTNWNAFLRQRAAEGDTDALDVLQSKPSVGGIMQTRQTSLPEFAFEKPDYNDPLVIEKFLQTALDEITGRLGLFEKSVLHKEISTYALLREVPLKANAITAFMNRSDVAIRFVVVPGSDPVRPVHTTKALLQAEADNRIYLAQGRGRFPLQAKAEIAKELDAKACELFDFAFVGEQRTAALGILTSEDFITCVQGDPGTGKTTMLKAVVATHGVSHVVGLSTAGIAAKKLGDETGVLSMTIARFCIDYERRQLALESDMNEQVLLDTAYIEIAFADNRGMLLVDEASMTSSMDANRLCRIAAREKARIVLVGDTRQLPGVGAGKPFERWQEQGAATLRLSQIRRQQSNQERTAVEAVTLRDSVTEALGLLEAASDSRVVTVPKKDERVGSIITEYMHHFDRTGQPPLLITSLNKDRLIFNEHIRAQLKTRGLVTTQDYEQTIELPTGEKQTRAMAEGDEIFFMRKLPQTDIFNGTRARITKLEGADYTVELADGATAQFNGESFRHFDHAYSLSTYKAQGQSADTHVIYHAPSYSPLLTRNEFLVGISRNKHHVSIYTDSREDMLKKARELAVKNTALEIFERGKLRAKGSEYLRALGNIAGEYTSAIERAGEERKTAIKDSKEWRMVLDVERKRINALYQVARDGLFNGLRQAEKFTSGDNSLEDEARLKHHLFMERVLKFDAVQGDGWSKAQAEKRGAEYSFAQDIERNYTPGGIKTSWEPQREDGDIFERDDVITPEKRELFKEYRQAVVIRRTAFDAIREEQKERSAELRRKWRIKRAGWKRDTKLQPRDTAKLISASKSRQLAEEEKTRAKFTVQRNQLREEAPFVGWAGFVHHKAKHGNMAAMNIWSTLGDMMPRSMDMEADPERIMDTLQRRVDNRGNTLYTLPSGGMVKDNGGKIHFTRDIRSREIATRLAHRKYGSHFIQQGTGTMLAGRRQNDDIVYTLALGVLIRETENAISFTAGHNAAKQAALGLAGRKFEGQEMRVTEKGIIVGVARGGELGQSF
jgi:hypothetical protein